MWSARSSLPRQQFFAIGPDFTFGCDVPVEGLAGNAEFDTQLGDRSFRLAHSGLGEPQLGGRHLERATTMPAPRAGGSETSAGALSRASMTTTGPRTSEPSRRVAHTFFHDLAQN